MVKNNKIFKMRLDGGTLCLDFINTINDRFVKNPRDYITNTEDLITWALRLQIIDEDQYKFLLNSEKVSMPSAEKILNEAITLRELLYRIFSRISRDEEIRYQDIVAFNKKIPHYFSKLELSKKGDKYVQKWNFSKSDLHLIIAPVILDAYSLLLDSRFDKIKECPKCGWLFIDNSKNGKRRWCSMQTCGSNVKALEWYHRQKKGSSG